MADLRRARGLAAELLQAHGVQHPPVNVQAIAEAEGVRIVVKALEERISGLLVRKGGATSIGVNALHHPNRQRFTLAHELGHLHLHDAGPTAVHVDAAESMVYFRSGTADAPPNPVEIEANTFAAALLMPEHFVREDLDGSPVDAHDESAIRRLARRYGVSQQALTIRLMELGLLNGVA